MSDLDLWPDERTRKRALDLFMIEANAPEFRRAAAYDRSLSHEVRRERAAARELARAQAHDWIEWLVSLPETALVGALKAIARLHRPDADGYCAECDRHDEWPCRTMCAFLSGAGQHRLAERLR